MWIGGSEGVGYRYEVLALADGYVVRMRDLDTGAVESGEATLFRTAPVAFAHAQAMAAIDRFAAKLLLRRDARFEREEARRCEARSVALKTRFGDSGCGFVPAISEQRAAAPLFH